MSHQHMRVLSELMRIPSVASNSNGYIYMATDTCPEVKADTRIGPLSFASMVSFNHFSAMMVTGLHPWARPWPALDWTGSVGYMKSVGKRSGNTILYREPLGPTWAVYTFAGAFPQPRCCGKHNNTLACKSSANSPSTML